jgi:hypothetical protein
MGVPADLWQRIKDSYAFLTEDLSQKGQPKITPATGEDARSSWARPTPKQAEQARLKAERAERVASIRTWFQRHQAGCRQVVASLLLAFGWVLLSKARQAQFGQAYFSLPGDYELWFSADLAMVLGVVSLVNGGLLLIKSIKR